MLISLVPLLEPICFLVSACSWHPIEVSHRWVSLELTVITQPPIGPRVLGELTKSTPVVRFMRQKSKLCSLKIYNMMMCSKNKMIATQFAHNSPVHTLFKSVLELWHVHFKLSILELIMDWANGCKKLPFSSVKIWRRVRLPRLLVFNPCKP